MRRHFTLTLFIAPLVADPGRLPDLTAHEAALLLATEGGLCCCGNLQLWSGDMTAAAMEEQKEVSSPS